MRVNIPPLKSFLALTKFNQKKPEQSVQYLLKELLETTQDKEIQSYQRALEFYSDKLEQIFE